MNEMTKHMIDWIMTGRQFWPADLRARLAVDDRHSFAGPAKSAFVAFVKAQGMEPVFECMILNSLDKIDWGCVASAVFDSLRDEGRRN